MMDARHAPQTFAGSRYVALGAGEMERLLEDGLRHKRAGEIEAAQRSFMAAARLAPRSHLPALLLGDVGPPAAAIEALTRAEALNPLSCHAPYLRGTRLLEVGDAADAAAAFERARAIAPSFGAPQERLGALAEAAGRIEDACRLYEEAALQNGTFALPIARLAELAQRDGKIDKAVGLLERILQRRPGSVADQLPDRPRVHRAQSLSPGARAPAPRRRGRRRSRRGADRARQGGDRPRQRRRGQDRARGSARPRLTRSVAAWLQSDCKQPRAIRVLA